MKPDPLALIIFAGIFLAVGVITDNVAFAWGSAVLSAVAIVVIKAKSP